MTVMKIFMILNEWIYTVFLLVLLMFYTAYWYLSKPKNIPPGPPGLPLLGYIPFLGKVPYEKFTRLSKKYGSIYSLYIGNRLVVILSDFQATNEAFVKKAEIFSGRPQEMKFLFPIDNFKSILTEDGSFWRDHRRFALILMRNCGVGKSSFESKIMNEICQFLNKVKNFKGKCFDIRDILSVSVANNISIMALGKQYDFHDHHFLQFKHNVDMFNQLSGTANLLLFFQWLKYVPGARQLLQYDRLRNIILNIQKFIRHIADEHKVNYSDGQRDNYVNAYITEQRARYKTTKHEDKIFSDEALVNNMLILEGAGIETTTTLLLWTIIFMMRHPEVQKRVQDEIEQMIGHDRVPSWNDRFRTPYTEATLCESQRMSNFLPINFPHRNIEECQLMGYNIPRDTYILVLLGNIMNSPKLWGDPQNFRPERFLNDKRELERPPYFIPFSTGKRQCLGENMAKMELYLYFTSMLQRFTFVKHTSEPPSLESHMGLANTPKNTTVCAIPRL